MERTTILERIRDLNKEYIKANTVASRQKLADVMVDNATAILSAIYTARGLCFSVNTMEWDIYKYHEIKENIQKLVEELDLDLECLDKEDRGKETDDTQDIHALKTHLIWLEGKLRLLFPIAEVLEEVHKTNPGLTDEVWDRKEEVRKTIRRMTEQEHDPDKTYLLDIETHERFRALCSFLDMIREASECMK